LEEIVGESFNSVVMGNTYLIPAFTVILMSVSCVNKREAGTSLDQRWVECPIVPKNILWSPAGDKYEAGQPKYSKFRTYYFTRDSVVFIFDCVNDRKVECRDTSIYDQKTRIYQDTAICTYKDSILFAVENLEMSKGTYHLNKSQVICKMPGFDDTLILADRGDALVSKDGSYVPSANFQAESYRRLFELMGDGPVAARETDSVPILLNQWREDSVGCLHVRSIERFKRLLDGYLLERKNKDEIVKLLGPPNAEERYPGKLVISYYFNSICAADKVVKGADRSMIELVFDERGRYLRWNTAIE